MNSIKLYIWLAALAGLLGSTVYFTSSYKDGQYAIEKQKQSEQYIIDLKAQQDAYDKSLKIMTDAALAKQTALSKVNSELEKKYADANRKANETLGKYNDLVNNGWRLRDPGTETSVQVCRTSEGGIPGAADSGDGTASGRQLSKEASQFLLGFASDADKVVEQLKVVQEYALRLKSICEK